MTLGADTCRVLAFDPGRNMQWPDLGNRRNPGGKTPVHEVGHRPHIGAARVRIPYIRGEKFQKADAGAVSGGGDKRRAGGSARGISPFMVGLGIEVENANVGGAVVREDMFFHGNLNIHIQCLQTPIQPVEGEAGQAAIGDL